jgi:hypothetical protein
MSVFCKKYSLSHLFYEVTFMQDDLDEQEQPLISELHRKIQILEAQNEKSIQYRMDYLTWTLANPITIIFIPIVLSVILEVIISNWDNEPNSWTFNNLTKTANWTIPIVVATVGFVISFGNKIYDVIQEKGDMNLLKALRADINGLRRELEMKEAKRDAERKEAEAKRDERWARIIERLEDKSDTASAKIDGVKDRVLTLEVKQPQQ